MTTELAPGRYLALDDVELRALRAEKGDPARRRWLAAYVAGASDERQIVIGTWTYLQWMFDPSRDPALPVDGSLSRGRSLHRGDFHFVHALASAPTAALLDWLDALDEAAFRARFFALDEAAFRRSYVPFWIDRAWQSEGVKTVLTEERAARAWTDLVALRGFARAALGAGRTIVFVCHWAG